MAPTTTKPLIVRLVLDGLPKHDVTTQERVFLAALSRKWPEEVRAKFFLTPGGYFKLIYRHTWRGTRSWNSTSDDMDEIISFAESHIPRLVSSRVLKAAEGKVDIITLGIDVLEGGIGANNLAELVAVVDVAKEKVVAWTGKSYPLGWQERSLVQEPDLDSHCVRVARERLLVLGCHDLTMFNPRAIANTTNKARKGRQRQMKRLVKEFRPTVILQHPHQTCKTRTWSHGWHRLLDDASRGGNTVKAWASGIAYGHYSGRSGLQDVLAKTSGPEGKVLDIVMRPSGH